MTIGGYIENGQVVLNAPVALANGTKVRVELTPTETETAADSPTNEESARTLYEILKPIIGTIKDAPSDFARNHDHYIHGTPKK
jgi:hypothetical protein